VVTGAAGFLGGAVTHALRQRGHEVLALDVRGGPGVQQADITAPGDWEKALEGADLLVHAAVVGLGGVGELPPMRAGRPGGPPVRVSEDELRRVVLGGTATVLDAADRAGVGRVVHLSCVSVLGRDFPDGVDEDAPVGLTGNACSDALAAAEQAVCAAAAHGRPVTVLRIGDAYGPRAGRWTLWPVLLLRAGRFALVDGGRGVLSPVYVDDVVDAVAAVAAAPASAVAGRVLHVTGGETVTAAEFFGHYARMAKLPAPRAVPARVFEAVGVVDRVRELAQRPWIRQERPRQERAGQGPSASRAARSPARPRPGVIRGFGSMLASGVDPRTHLDLGPLTVSELTRTGTYSIERIADLVGWRPAVPLTEGMARTEVWLRERGMLGVREPARRG